ncbi:MAG: 4'-phosphopantetheinyl transferase superfamily protein [Halioglobus sp.]
MSQREFDRNLRYSCGTLRDSDAITRALLRTVLSRYADCAPSQWEFAEDTLGKPYILRPRTQLYFNLSHTVDWVACAVARFAYLGIDIERCSRDPAVMRLADRFFSPREYADLLNLPEEKRKNRFFDYWTLKESYIKARGEGISLGLGKFSFAIFSADNIEIECQPELRENPGAWHFSLSSLHGDHRLALAARPPQPIAALDVKRFFTVPLSGLITGAEVTGGSAPP